MSLRESIIAVFFGTLVVISKYALRLPLHIPGHSGLIWMAVLTVCCLSIRKGRAGTLAGVVSGLLTIMLGLENEGFLTFFKFFLPGLTLDICFSLFPGAMNRWYAVAVIAAISHWTKLLANYIIGLILHLPMGFLVAGVQIATVNHLVFGALGGFVAYLICNNNLYRKYLRLQ